MASVAPSDTTTKVGHDRAAPFGGMTPAEAARKRWEKAKDEPEYVSPDEARAMGPELKAELVAAALGLGRWKKLPIDKQLAALVKANEYVNGRPLPMKDDAEDTDGPGFQVGIAPPEAGDGPS